MSDEDLAGLLRGQGGKLEARGWRCLSQGRVAAYVDGALDVRERAAVEAHLAGCSHCAAEVAMLVRLQQAGIQPSPNEHLLRQAIALVPRRAALGTLFWRWSAAAAASLLVAVVGYRMVLPLVTPPVAAPVPDRPEPAPTLSAQAPVAGAPVVRQARPLASQTPAPRHRTTRSDPATPATPELLVPSDGAVVGSGMELLWKGAPRTAFYKILVADSDGGLIWEERTVATRIRLPEGVRLIPGELYFVWVRAHLPEGKTVESPIAVVKAQ